MEKMWKVWHNPNLWEGKEERVRLRGDPGRSYFYWRRENAGKSAKACEISLDQSKSVSA